MIKRALSLSEKANTMVTPSTEVGVALAHAGVLEIGGQIELCEEFYMKVLFFFFFLETKASRFVLNFSFLFFFFFCRP